MLRKLYILLWAVSCFIGCGNDNTDIQPDTTPMLRTVLIYMVAENNLYKNAKQDIAEMQAYAERINGNLLVYLDAPAASIDSVPQLLKIEQGKIITIQKYGQQNSASGEVLQSVINDAVTLFPAIEYGLVLWSHGTGWLPEGGFDGLKNANSSRLRSFGLDNKKEMSLIELQQALSIHFEFIIFDACLMGGIEVAYQLRKKTNYLVASPTETLVAGFPYTEIVPLLFAERIDYHRITKTFTDYYENQSKEYLKSATLTAIHTGQLENLANFIRRVLDEKTTAISDKTYNPLAYELSQPIIYYDFFNFLQQLINDQNALNQLKQMYSEIVVSYEHTDFFFSDLSLANTTGLNFFIFPFYDEYLFSEYTKFDWYADTKWLAAKIDFYLFCR